MLPITKMPIRYNRTYKAGRKIDFIVIHDTANYDEGAGVDGHFEYFNGGNVGSSADFFVDSGKIGQFNPDLGNYYMWHCGTKGTVYTGCYNNNSIGIEICLNPESNYAVAVQNTIELVRYLMKEFNVPIEKVCRHYDVTHKNCPATMNVCGSWAKWDEFKSKLEEVKKVKYLVIYNNPIDKRGAERLAEHLGCPVLDGSQVTNFDYSIVENPIGVGGGTFNPAVKVVVKGYDRDDTTLAVLRYIGKIA